MQDSPKEFFQLPRVLGMEESEVAEALIAYTRLADVVGEAEHDEIVGPFVFIFNTALIFLVASEKRKLKVVSQPVPSAPKLKRKQFRIVGKAPEKIQHPISVQTDESLVSYLSSNPHLCLSSVSSRDAIPSTSKIIVVRKGNLPSDKVRSFIDGTPGPKKIFVIERTQQISEEVDDAPGRATTSKNVCDAMTQVQLESNSSSVQEMCSDSQTQTPESSQNAIDGQSASGTLPGSLHCQSGNRALPRRQGAKLIARNAYIEQLEAQMGSKDFHDRIGAIDLIVKNCRVNPGIVTSCIFQVFDSIRARLLESNRIVNLHMLKALETIIPQLKESLPKVTNLLIPAVVDSHLNSRNPAIYSAAVAAVRALVHNLDNALLVEIFATRAQVLLGQAKMDLTNTVADMVTEVYSQKPKLVEKEVLPLLWHMLAGYSNSAATAALFRALYHQMGARLRASAASQLDSVTMYLDHLLHLDSINQMRNARRQTAHDANATP
ncbi:hypothetical protein SKAU_G00239530 [Synaphobranchus kaupii]|uniref:TOG domain-containing protein n=1 Tax=Synaphobranchus kaupii TaxID=118154 RepID=A0A9Q1F768_SYNKA|nr:hypothetical protein SKAU_G00239530 [Synaphobranchus kaupii]